MTKSYSYTKRIVAIVLLQSFVFAIGIKSFITLSFYVNQESIITEQCENRSKPELQCNGKCYLAKQLKKAEQATEEQSGVPQQTKQFSFPDLEFILNEKVSLSSSFNPSQVFPNLKNLSILKGISSIFIPPPQHFA